MPPGRTPIPCPGEIAALRRARLSVSTDPSSWTSLRRARARGGVAATPPILARCSRSRYRAAAAAPAKAAADEPAAADRRRAFSRPRFVHPRAARRLRLRRYGQPPRAQPRRDAERAVLGERAR